MEKIVDRIKDIKDFYCIEVVKEITTDKILFGENMCLSPEGCIYVNCRETKTVIVFDEDLNELDSFEQKDISTGMAIANNFLITTHWRNKTIHVYDMKGQFVRSVDMDKEITPNMLPTVIPVNDNCAIFLDLRSNTLFFTRISTDSTLDIEKKITIQEKRFYDPVGNIWPCLRGITENEGHLYVAGEGNIFTIKEDGMLEKYDRIPFETQSITGLNVCNGIICLIDYGLNKLLVWKKNGRAKIYTFLHGKERGHRLSYFGDHIYILKNSIEGNSILSKVKV